MMKKFLAFAVCCAVLAGCETRVEDMSYPQRVALANEIVTRCRGYGIKTNAELKQCEIAEVQREVSRRDQQYVRNQQAALIMAAGMNNASQGYYRAAQTPTYVSPTVRCQSQPNGGGVMTTCN